jgi:hypothetical protein
MRGNGQNQLKIPAPHPMTENYRLIPLLAALISLDSPFKEVKMSWQSKSTCLHTVGALSTIKH